MQNVSGSFPGAETYRPAPMPQALGSSGAHIGVGRALFFATVTLEVEADETWVEATAPVRTRAATSVRTMIFMSYPIDVKVFMKPIELLPAGTHTAGIWIIRSAHWSWEGAVLRYRDLGGGSGRYLGRCDCTGEDEGGNDCANNDFHVLSY